MICSWVVWLGSRTVDLEFGIWLLVLVRFERRASLSAQDMLCSGALRPNNLSCSELIGRERWFGLYSCSFGVRRSYVSDA